MLGVISDTHDNTDAIKKAVEFFKSSGVRLVLHAGDIVSPFTAGHFIDLGVPMKCVFGNNDGDPLALAESYAGIADFRSGWRKIQFGDVMICLSHRELPENPRDCGIVVFGHTHNASIIKTESRLILNPGECCGWVSGRRTVAVVDAEKMEAEIIEI